MPIINERYMKLLTNYIELKPEIMVSDDPYKKCAETISVLHLLLGEIKPEFFMEPESYEWNLKLYRHELKMLETNIKLLNV